MQHVVPNNVARCCVEMLRAFGQALISLVKTEGVKCRLQPAGHCCTITETTQTFTKMLTFDLNNRELKILRRRRQQQRRKTKISLVQRA